MKVLHSNVCHPITKWHRLMWDGLTETPLYGTTHRLFQRVNSWQHWHVKKAKPSMERKVLIRKNCFASATKNLANANGRMKLTKKSARIVFVLFVFRPMRKERQIWNLKKAKYQKWKCVGDAVEKPTEEKPTGDGGSTGGGSEVIPPADGRPRILALHGGGGDGAGFSHDQGMRHLMDAVGDNFEFVFASAPQNGLWMRDPPG